jgi:hypothetical protein
MQKGMFKYPLVKLSQWNAMDAAFGSANTAGKPVPWPHGWIIGSKQGRP